MPKKPIDYANGLQYKIVCKDPAITDCYNGSTCSFKDRKYKHKTTCNNPNADNYNLKVYRFIRENGGWDNWTMIQLELSPCNSEQQLRLREREIFDILKPTLNSYSPTLDVHKRKKTWAEYNATHKEERKKNKAKYDATHKEDIKKHKAKYYEQNKAEILVKMKEYRDVNAAEIATIKKIKITCECGCVSTKSDLPKHQRTQKHLAIMAQKS